MSSSRRAGEGPAVAASEAILDRARGAYLGLAIGDALAGEP